MKGERRAAVRGAGDDGVDRLQERGVSVFERHTVEPKGKPADVGPAVHQKPADGHEAAFVGTGVLGERSGEEPPHDGEVDGEQQERARRQRAAPAPAVSERQRVAALVLAAQAIERLAAIDARRGGAPLGYRPDDQALAAHHVAAGEHARDRCLEGAVD